MPDADANMDVDPEARRQIEELRELFRPHLAERVREIEAAWESVRAGGAGGDIADPDALKRLHRLAHSLSGAAGTFGYPEVGIAARALERGLERWLPGKTGGMVEIPEITEIIVPLLATLAQATAAAA
jgi:HPt (histidine-containing phosphotransfer) domain-containing protein